MQLHLSIDDAVVNLNLALVAAVTDARSQFHLRSKLYDEVERVNRQI